MTSNEEREGAGAGWLQQDTVSGWVMCGEVGVPKLLVVVVVVVVVVLLMVI